ncbi:MAG TPA: hypothetical protein DHV48_15375 [Prolixibacteraceae bacterium]|nr:hypothetical protein [Prolixibacteraceae bacterium]
MTWTATLTPTASVEDATNVITLDNTGVADAAGNAGAGTTDSNNYAIDTNPPSVINVTSSTSNGIYKASDVITILITYSEPVTITGTPTLSLNSGGSASYASGTATATLTFNYTVGNGQSTTDLDYLSTTALILEGGTIADAAGNDGILTLPTVGGLNSIGGQKDIVIKSGQNITFNALPTKIYGDANFTPSATSSSGLTVTFTTSDSNVATIVGGQIHIVGAGTCTIFADQIGNSTYLAAAQESQALTVNKATLTVSADTQTKIYGEANPTLTFVYSGWQNGDDADDLTTKPTASTTVTVTSPAAVYSNAITVSGGVDENYDFTYVPANMEVTKAMLTVTADAKIKGYDSPIPPLTFKYSGWENGDDASVLATPPTMTTTVTVATPVGKYPNSIIGIGGSDVNYDFTFIAADFEVTKANQAITFAVLPSKTYGDPAFDLVANTNSGLKTSFTSSNPEVAMVSGNKLTIVGAGATTITAIQEGTNNFNAAPSVSHSFVVNRKVVVVENATAVSKEYDGTATAVVQGSSLSGIINADEVILENESGTFAQITAGINIAVSTAMTLSGEKAGNYELAQPSGLKADILKKEITVTAEPISKACSENDPVFTYRYAPELVGPDSFTGALSREVGTSVGAYAIVQGSLSLSGNYQLIYQGADFTITDSAPVWITAPMALNMTLEYADVAGLLAAQSLVPEAFDACENILPAPVKISGEFVKVADCNHVGNYVNTWTVTDHSGNVSNEYTQVITLVDRIIPKIQELPSIVLTVAPGVCETKINYPEIKVFDDCIGKLELKSGLGKDGLFPVGTTMETWEVTDQSGNTATAYFAVTVKSYNEAPKVDLIDDQSVAKYTKEVEVPLSGIDPTSGCTLQEIVSITAEADDKLLISEVLVDYSKGSTTGKLILKIADKAEGETMIRVTVKDNGGVENGGSDTRIMTFMVKIDRPTGLTDLSQNMAAEVYPNPSHGKVNVVVTGALTSTVRIVSVAGVEVYKNTRVTDSVLNVDLSKSLAGIYFVEISDGKQSIVKKLILRN